MTREELFANLKVGARWDVGVSINRSNSLPLDANSIFESYAAAAAYASKDADRIAPYGFLNNAYIGQILAVIEDKTVGEETVTTVGIYYIDADLQLQPVGKEVVADGKSIVNNNGTITLYGFESAATATLPRKKADGTIEWVTVDAVVAGATKNTITTGDNISIENVEIKDENDEVTSYTVKLKNIDSATNGQVPFYTETPTAEGTVKSLVWKDVYTKTEVDNKITGIMSFRGVAKSLVNDNKDIIVAGEDGDVTITAAEANRGHVYIIGDKEYISTGEIWEELGFSVDLSGYYTKDETDTAIDSAVAAEKERAEGIESGLDSRITTLENLKIADTYATKEEVSTLSDTVATLSGNLTALEGTVSEEKGKLATLQGTVSTLSNTVDGHTDVLATLRTDVDDKVAKSTYEAYVEDREYTDTKIDELIAGVDVSGRVATLEGVVGNADSGLVKDVTDNKNSITNLTNKIGTLESADTAILERLGALESTDQTHTADISALKTSVADHTTALAGLGGTVKEVTDANALAAANAQSAADAAAQAVVTLETGKVATNTTNITALGTRVTTLEDAVSGLSGAMKFVGVFDALPNPNDYEAGNVVIVGAKEYVLNPNTKLWEEFGDASDFYTKDVVYTKTETDAAISAAMSWSEME